MSYGLSRGRTLEPGSYGIESSELPSFEEGPLDPRAWFEEPDHDFQIEIGSGKGTFLVQQAPLRPEVNYLGIEWSGEFFKYAADRMRRHELGNVRMLHADATEFLRYWCADGVASVIHLYFSDPWPKARHHKRRVVQDRTLEDLWRVLAPGGELRLVTDHDADTDAEVDRGVGAVDDPVGERDRRRGRVLEVEIGIVGTEGRGLGEHATPLGLGNAEALEVIKVRNCGHIGSRTGGSRKVIGGAEVASGSDALPSGYGVPLQRLPRVPCAATCHSCCLFSCC